MCSQSHVTAVYIKPLGPDAKQVCQLVATLEKVLYVCACFACDINDSADYYLILYSLLLIIKLPANQDQSRLFVFPVPNSGFEREMTCRSWGQYNFETFDGLYYYFPGRCTYTLLRDCEDTKSSSIIVQVQCKQACYPPII